MASLTWSASKTPRMDSLVEVCVTFRPGVLDEYDKETKDIMSELKGLLRHPPGMGPSVPNPHGMKVLASLAPSGPGPPPHHHAPRPSRAVTMETMVSTLVGRDAFSEGYIGTLRSDVRVSDDVTSSNSVNPLQTKPRGLVPKRRPGIKARLSRDLSVSTSGGMAEVTSSPPEGGPLTVSAEDGSIKKFSILPPIEPSDQPSSDPPEPPGAPRPPADPADPPRTDPDYHDPASYGWHVTSVERWPTGSDDTTSSVPKLGPVNNLRLPLRPAVPSSTGFGGVGLGVGKSAGVPQRGGGIGGVPIAASDATVSNSYVAMSVMTSGQEELKRHLKQRQQQRASDQREFQAESVNGKPLNSSGTYMIKYGDVEVPTTDVELYAILSVEKHNSPFATEFEVAAPMAVSQNTKEIAEKMEAKLDNLVEKDRMESKAFSSEAVEKFFATESDHEILSDEGGNVNAPDGPKSKTDSPEMSLPVVHSGKQSGRAGPPKLGHIIAADTRVKRRGKQGQLYKCYDTTKPLAVKAKQQAESQPITLKPLVSTAVVEQQQQLQQQSQQQQRPQQQLQQKPPPPPPNPQPQPQQQKPTFVKITPLKRNSQNELQVHPEEGPISVEDGSRSARRNISVTLPVMTCDEDDGSSQATTQDGGCNLDDLRPDTPPKGIITTSRQPYCPPKVILGNTKNATPLSEIPSRSSSGTSRNSLKSARQRAPEEDSRKGPDEGDLEMNDGTLSVTGASLSRRGSVVGGGNMNNSNNSQGHSGSSQGHIGSSQGHIGNNSNSSSDEYARRAAPPRIGVPMRSRFQDDQSDAPSSVSRMSVSSDPIDSRSSSAHWRHSPQIGENSGHATRSTPSLTPDRLSTNTSRTSSTSLLASSRGNVNYNATGSLPELQPATTGIAVNPVASRGLKVVPVRSGHDPQGQRSSQQTVLPGFHDNGQVVVPEIRMILPTPQPPRYSSDQRSSDRMTRLQKH